MKSSMKYSSNRKSVALFALACASLLLAFLLGVTVGSTRLSLTALAKALAMADMASPDLRIFLYVRLSRTLGAILAGGALALSGAVIQGVLGNRLASPSVIGVNAGAGLGVTLAAAFGIVGGVRLSLFAFLGAFGAVLLVSLGARKWGASPGTVILMGVALSALFGAVSDTVITFLPDLVGLRGTFRIGDFSAVNYMKLLPAAAVILPSAVALFFLSRPLDALSLGEENARSLGLNTRVARPVLLLLAAALAGAAVSYAGLLSFVGLLVPHAVRRFSGAVSHRLLPLSFLFGGAFVCLADTLSRTLFAPYEIPVGIPIAFLGAPFFLFVLIRGKGGASHA